MESNKLILYLSTRAFPLERTAEIKAAQDAGVEIVMAAPSIEPYREYNLAHFIEAPVTKHAEARRIILDHLQKTGIEVQGLVAWSEHQVELAAQLGVDLGLPSTTPDAASNVRNKSNTRRVLDRLDGVNPKYAIANDEESFKAALEIVGVPCLIKPSGSSGGRGIFKIHSYDEALLKFNQFREYCDPQRDDVYSYFNHEFIVEEKLTGSEHSVSGMVADGEIIVFALTDKKINFKVPIQYENITPSALPQETQDRIIRMVRSAVELTGINWCGFHVDLMVTPKGPKILEMGGRLGGECINSHLIPLSTSIKPYELLLQVVRGLNPFTKTDYTGDAINRAGMRAILPPKTGRILRLEGIDKVRLHPNTRELLELRQPGDELVLPSVKFGGYEIGNVIAQCNLDQNIEAILEEIASLVRVEVDS